MVTNNKDSQAQIKKSLWGFGTQEVRNAAIGTALYIILEMARSMFGFPYFLAPKEFIVVFFGLLFGPLVGFFVGFLGYLTFLIFPITGVWLWWGILPVSLMGLVAGLGSGLLGTPVDRSYKNWKTLLYGFWLWWEGILILMGQKAWKPLLRLILKVWKALGFATLGWIVYILLSFMFWIWVEDPNQRLTMRAFVNSGTSFMINLILMGLLLVGIIKRREDAIGTTSDHL